VRSLAILFGRVDKLLMLQSKNQALLEMDDLEDAIKLVDFYSTVPANIRCVCVLCVCQCVLVCASVCVRVHACVRVCVCVVVPNTKKMLANNLEIYISHTSKYMCMYIYCMINVYTMYERRLNIIVHFIEDTRFTYNSPITKN